MNRPWGATGAADQRIIQRLSEITKEQIKTEIRAHGRHPKNGYEDLFLALERAIVLFKKVKKLAKDSSPGRVRENLNKSLRLALRLNDALNDLDGNSRQLLSQYMESSTLQGEYLVSIVTALNKAKLDADQYPKSGSNPANERIILVLELDHVLSTHINCHFTTTKVTLFSSVLTLVYQEATGKTEVKNVSELLRDAKKWERIVLPGGGIEYRRRETN